MSDSNKRRTLFWLSGGFVSLLLVGAVALAALPVSAFGRHGGEGRHGEGGREFMQSRVEKMLDRVEATDEQKEKILAITEARMESMHGLRPDRRAMHDEAVSILTAETVDRAALEAFRAQQVERFTEASKAIADTLAEVAAVLEPEQRVALAEAMEERREHRRGRGFRH